MKQSILIVAMFFIATSFASAYDKMLAESYAQYFKPFSAKATSKLLHMMQTPDFVKGVRAEKLFVLDIRTPGESGVFGITIPESVAIPMDQVFKPENLTNLPTTGKIVIVCKSGHRSMAVSTALRHIGFDNVYTLNWGTRI